MRKGKIQIIESTESIESIESTVTGFFCVQGAVKEAENSEINSHLSSKSLGLR